MGTLAANLTEALQERATDLVEAQSTDRVQEIVSEAEREAVRRSVIPNTFVYKATVIVMGISVLAVIAAQMWIALARSAAHIPDGLIAIGSAAIGALAGMLAPTPAR